MKSIMSILLGLTLMLGVVAIASTVQVAEAGPPGGGSKMTPRGGDSGTDEDVEPEEHFEELEEAQENNSCATFEEEDEINEVLLFLDGGLTNEEMNHLVSIEVCYDEGDSIMDGTISYEYDDEPADFVPLPSYDYETTGGGLTSVGEISPEIADPSDFIGNYDPQQVTSATEVT